MWFGLRPDGFPTHFLGFVLDYFPSREPFLQFNYSQISSTGTKTERIELVRWLTHVGLEELKEYIRSIYAPFIDIDYTIYIQKDGYLIKANPKTSKGSLLCCIWKEEANLLKRMHDIKRTDPVFRYGISV